MYLFKDKDLKIHFFFFFLILNYIYNYYLYITIILLRRRGTQNKFEWICGMQRCCFTSSPIPAFSQHKTSTSSHNHRVTPHQSKCLVLR